MSGRGRRKQTDQLALDMAGTAVSASNNEFIPGCPHTIDLRKSPVCYLCGARWSLNPPVNGVVECQGCGLKVVATYDEEVFKARRWTGTADIVCKDCLRGAGKVYVYGRWECAYCGKVIG